MFGLNVLPTARSHSRSCSNGWIHRSVATLQLNSLCDHERNWKDWLRWFSSIEETSVISFS